MPSAESPLSPIQPTLVGCAIMGAMPRLLTADDVADLLRFERSWVYAQARADRIPHVRLGRYVRFDQEAVETWIKD